MSREIAVRINGRKERIEEGLTVARLLSARKINPETVVVEINLDIIPRDAHESRRLAAGDRVEILHFVGGG